MEGFVFAEHSMPILRRMAGELPQAIALADDRVVGYCLAMHPSLRDALPSLAPTFGGHGPLSRLYGQIRRSLPSTYELCVTEIATRNQVSIRAHQRIGFQTIDTYSDEEEQRVIVAWDLR